MNPYTASDLPLHDLNTSDSCSAAGDLHKEFFGGADQSRDQCRGCRVWMSSMTHYRGPISNLITHVEVLSRGGGSNVTMVRLIEGGLDPGLATTVAELATICNRTDQRDRAEAIVASLVALAPADDLAGLGALAALSPALIRLSRRLITAGVRPEQADIDVIATAYERIVTLGDQPRRHAARSVISGTWDRLRASLDAAQRCALREHPLEAASDPVAHSTSATTAPGLRWVLTDAVAAGAISAEAARIIDGSRCHGRTLRSLACELHKSESAVRQTRNRAERTLIDRHRPDRSSTHATSTCRRVIR